jgi:hypothetical protein
VGPTVRTCSCRDWKYIHDNTLWTSWWLVIFSSIFYWIMSGSERDGDEVVIMKQISSTLVRLLWQLKPWIRTKCCQIILIIWERFTKTNRKKWTKTRTGTGARLCSCFGATWWGGAFSALASKHRVEGVLGDFHKPHTPMSASHFGLWKHWIPSAWDKGLFIGK